MQVSRLQRLGLLRGRALHLTPLLAETGTPRRHIQQEDTEPDDQIESKNAQARHSPLPSPEPERGVGVRGEGREDLANEEAEEEEVSGEMKVSWKELPNLYLKLSKSRLTSVSGCVCIALCYD